MKHPRVVLAVSLSALLALATTVGPFLPSRLDAATVSLTRGPYLQLGTPSSLVVRWRSSGASDSLVQYGPDPATLTSSATLAAVTTEHAVTLSGLTPNTRYYYAIGSTTQRLAGGDTGHFFVTAPVSGTAVPTRIWVLGDSGTANANAASVRNAYYNFSGSTAPNLWLMLGDNAYNDGYDSEYQAAVFDMFPATLRQSVLWPTMGNHDTADSVQGTGPYYDIFTLPKTGQAGGLASGTEAYYSFDYANIHFVCLNSFDVDITAGSPMMTWLQNDVASTTQRWTIAFWHHPPYSKGSHDSDIDWELTQMRQNALPILEAAGVDLVLTGHSHSYERSFLIDGHYGRSNTFTASMKKNGGSGRENGSGAYLKPSAGSAPHAGAVYTVAGSSGFNDTGFPLNHPAMYISMAVLGSLVLDINDGRLDARFVDNTSTVRDYFTILKGSVQPLSVTTTSLPGGNAGIPYSQALAATGGLAPYTWSITAGSLPPGLSLNAASGVISGTPTATGAPAFTVQARDSSSPNLTAQRQLSISIGDAIPPVVSLLAPAGGSTVFDLVSITATASDNVGVTAVHFTIDGTTQGVPQHSPPYGLVWDSTTVTDGLHAIAVTASDAAGNTKSASVTVTVNNSPTRIVPNVVSLTQAAASTAITGAGLVVGTVGNASSATVPAGSVISQNPVGGTQVTPGSAVNLVVSSGPPLVAVPNVVNQTQAAATAAIAGAGLVVGTVTSASSATVPAGSVISQNPVAGTQVVAGSGINLVVSSGPAPPGPVVDAVVFSDGLGTRTTPAFSTTAPGGVLVAFAASDGPAGPQSLTVSGAGLTWTRVGRANTQPGTAEIWRAKAVGQLTNVTVRSTLSVTGYKQSLTVVAFRGATGVGAAAIANGLSGAPSVTLVTSRANSLVYGTGFDWDGAVARTLGSNQAMVHQWVVAGSGTYWVQRRNAAVPIAGTSVQLNDTAPTNDRWNFASVEIVP